MGRPEPTSDRHLSTEVTRVVAPLSARMWATCRGFSTGLMGTNTASAAAAPKIEATIAGVFSRYTATRSPRSTPAERSHPAKRSASSRSAAYDTVIVPAVRAGDRGVIVARSARMS